MSSPASSRTRHRRTRSEQYRLHEQAVHLLLRLFDEGGYEAISMRKLASEIGVPPMSLYRYFPSKKHLIQHIWAELLLRAYRHALVRAHECSSPPERLGAYLDGYLQYWLDNRNHYWVVFSIREGGTDAAEPGDAAPCPNPYRFLETLAELIGACAGRDGGSEVRRLAEVLFCETLGFLTGVIGMASLASADIEGLKRRLVREMVDQAITGGGGPDAASAASPVSEAMDGR